MQHLINLYKKELSPHLVDYLVLSTCGVLFLLGLRLFTGNRAASYIIILIFANLYIIWGVSHHALHKNLHLKNVVEYILIGFFVMFLMKLLINY